MKHQRQKSSLLEERDQSINSEELESTGIRKYVDLSGLSCTRSTAYILNKTIVVEKVDTQHQRADIFTKALPHDAFRYLRKTIIGW